MQLFGNWSTGFELRPSARWLVPVDLSRYAQVEAGNSTTR
jgi:hypothetical protein